jgi:PAS domain S-box-containing protein
MMPTRRQLLLEIEELRTQLEEAGETLRAIRSSEVDALIVNGPKGEQVFALKGAEQPYRVLVEAINEGAITLFPDHTVSYCNQRFADMVKTPLEQVIGGSFERFVAQGCARNGRSEASLLAKDGSRVPVVLSAGPVELDGVEGVCLVVTDITERQHAEDALRASECRYRRFLERNAAGVLRTAEDRILEANAALARILGYDSIEELQQRRAGELYFHDGDRHTMLDLIRTQKALVNYPVTLRHKHGHAIWALENATLVEEDIVETTVIDISESKRAEEQIHKLNADLEHRIEMRTAELQAVNKELEAFSYSVAHDLRAPLRHINGFARLLMDEHSKALPEDAQHYLAGISEAALRLSQLVDDLLRLTRVGRSQLSLQPVSLRRLVDEVLREMRPEVESRHIEWRIGSLPVLNCDAGLIKDVFTNLLSNAIKFTRPRACAVIEVGTVEQQGVPVIFVKDNGVGFNMEYAGKLFGVFQRLHRKDEFEGTGVGLATVHRVVERHGGRVWAESAPDRGATFYFTLAPVTA